ncbi:response regulator [Helicobacter saguini]|uniref:Response regulator n=1 Tax=Helicobacter saguini TaxID=1548018 RepID=A0A4U8T498_9HELI|nr:response regulator transcription factor [Helicobacter saguini]MWV62071.1 response regulator [Helicobacter saguini]MWV67255.1 response regulator [Helicobacter saguini]MWV69609.1 response regulator [Helicobacter saguini]TLD94321.1 response regulator transcription factor [Helicobacter saguini]
MLEVLMIEDDVELAEVLSEYLRENDINVTNYDEPYTGMSALATKNFDLLLLDLTLPNLDGLDVCKKVAKQKNIPIIISSARSDVNDKVKALDYGADDYIAKPYDPKELVARIQSLIRRYSQKMAEENSADKSAIFRIDKDTREVYFKDKKLDLTRAEYEILTLLISKKGHVFSREAIAIESESINPESSNKSIDVIIGRLRSKIEENPKNPQYIISVRGVGYKLEA